MGTGVAVQKLRPPYFLHSFTKVLTKDITIFYEIFYKIFCKHPPSPIKVSCWLLGMQQDQLPPHHREQHAQGDMDVPRHGPF